MSEREKAHKYLGMCIIAHYCDFEDRNLLLSEPEVHTKNLWKHSPQVIFLISAPSFGRMCQ